MITAIKAIIALSGGTAQVGGSGIDDLTWFGTTPIPRDEILAKMSELEAAEPIRLLRKQRNALLAATDWRDLPSYAGTRQAEWRVYRQALRDITVGLDTADKVKAATFPSQPS